GAHWSHSWGRLEEPAGRSPGPHHVHADRLRDPLDHSPSVAGAPLHVSPVAHREELRVVFGGEHDPRGERVLGDEAVIALGTPVGPAADVLEPADLVEDVAVLAGLVVVRVAVDPLVGRQYLVGPRLAEVVVTPLRGVAADEHAVDHGVRAGLIDLPRPVE